MTSHSDQQSWLNWAQAAESGPLKPATFTSRTETDTAALFHMSRPMKIALWACIVLAVVTS
jgi:hypothetical protein